MRKKQPREGRQKRTKQEAKNRRTKYQSSMLVKSVEERKRLLAKSAISAGS